ncbi:UTP-glucose-1-phosphate uridylyltransferase [Pseudozyma hubeiensis]|nr:UTP-glucose-1-phosphate uridylyltransferase [Pseudozyma hubeiensis]
MFVTEIKVVSRGYSGNPRRKEEEEDDSEEEDSVDVADERLNDVPNVQMKCEAQQEVDTHVDAEEETQAQLDQGRNPDGHRPWRPLSSAALQSIQHKQSQQAQRTAYTDFDHDDSDDIVLDYEQDGHDVQQASVGRSNKRRALPFGSGLLEALQPGAKRSRAT